MTAPADSTLSIACRAIAAHLAAELKRAGAETQVVIGAPWAVAAMDSSERRLGMFFYRFEPFGFDADTAADQTWWLRLHCVVSSFAIDESSIGAGENDLRLLGHVLRIFHEAPIFGPVAVGDETMVAQVVFEPLGLDELNRLWSTQKDAPLRVSLGYEFALTPVVPSKRAVEPPLVGVAGVGARGTLDRRAAFTGNLVPRPFALRTVDTTQRDWAPRIAFHVGGEDVEFVSFGLTGWSASLDVSVAGADGESILFTWEVWAANGWTTSTETTTFVIAPGKRATVDVPFSAPITGAMQAVLRATRSITDRWDETLSVELQSNALLVSLHQDSGP